MAAPNIVSVLPTRAGVGDTLTVTGTGFGASQGSSRISYGGQPVAPIAWSDTSITFNVPVTAGVHKYANASAPTDNDVVITVGAAASKLKHTATK